MIRIGLKIYQAGACAVPMLLPVMAMAQVSSAPQTPAHIAGKSGGLEEIVVTAERRQSRLQSVPISVTALTTRSLAQKQVTDVISLARVVPSLQSKPTITPLEVSVAIRGVTQLIPSLAEDPAIGTYIDGIYNVLNAGSNTALIDMERVEVLKGPQGTLFGRNTIGGAISIITAKPTDHFGGYIEAGAANYEGRTVTGALNGPVVPGVLDARVAFQYTGHSGYGHNYVTGNPTSTLDQEYVRTSAKYTPSSNIEVLGTGFYTHADGYSFPSNLGYIDTVGSLAPGLPPTNALIPTLSGHPGDLLSNYIIPGSSQNAYSDIDNRFFLKQFGGTLTATDHLGAGVTVRSITGYVNTSYNTIEDLAGTPYNYLDLVGYPIRSQQVSEELQAFGDALDGRLKYIGGLYYFNVQGSQISQAKVLEELSPGINYGGPKVNESSYSAFAQLTYTILPHVDLTGGFRYVVDTRAVNYHDFEGDNSGAYEVCHLANAPYDPNYQDCGFRDSVRYHYVPFTVGVDYKPTSDILLYGKYSEGYRSGAFGITGPAATAAGGGVTQQQAAEQNTRALALFGPVAPESLTSPEIGAKLELFQHHLRLNVAAYYSDYSNIQVTQDVPNTNNCTTCTPVAVLENTGEAHIYGTEIEMTALLGGFELDAGFGYVDPQYVAGPSVGTPIINVSKTTASLTGSYPVETKYGTLNLATTYAYRSSAVFYTLAPGLPESARATFTQPGLSLLDARLSFDFARWPVTLSVYGQNLTDAKYITAATSYGAPLSFTVRSPGIPRIYGATLRYTF